MWILIAALVAGATYFATLALVRRILGRPLPLVAPIALAVVIASETLVLNVLSTLHSVTRTGVLCVHVTLFALALAAIRGLAISELWRTSRRVLGAVRSLGLPGFLLFPVLLLLVASAWRYAPNNWDSMTYHMARVAHWIQGASVEAYPTSIRRQITLGPGAEYLLLVLQVISGSDRLANFLQLFSWGLVVLAAPALARLAGARRPFANWSVLLVGSAPMLVLQATSTQNDLVAAAMTVAILAASVPFLHRDGDKRRRGRDVAALAVVGAAAMLVKPLAIIAALPIVALAMWNLGRWVIASPDPGKRAAVTALATGAATGLVAPDLLRAWKGMSESPDAFSAYLYPLWGDWGDRIANIVRGTGHHLPLPTSWVRALGMNAAEGCRPSSLCFGMALRLHEDFAGNPVNAAIAGLLLAIAAFRWRDLVRPARSSAAAVLLSWIVFHLVVRDNAWVSRLQTPLFAMTPLLLGVVPRARAQAAALAVLATTALIFGGIAARNNETRPPLESPWWSSRPDLSYYVGQPRLWLHHSLVLEAAREVGCTRIGLRIGADSYDYPLTWGAMQLGMEVRHLVSPDEWPCVVFSESGIPPGSWFTTQSPYVFVSASAVRHD